MEINTQTIRDRVTRITGRYNPDWDVIAEAPLVVWASNELAEICIDLVNQIEHLQKQINSLESIVDNEREIRRGE